MRGGMHFPGDLLPFGAAWRPRYTSAQRHAGACMLQGARALAGTHLGSVAGDGHAKRLPKHQEMVPLAPLQQAVAHFVHGIGKAFRYVVVHKALDLWIGRHGSVLALQCFAATCRLSLPLTHAACEQRITERRTLHASVKR